MTVVSPCTQDLMDSAHPQTVLTKLNEQRSQGLFCDVTIVVEDVKFRAHKNILAACSGYFRNALTTPETWSSSQVLELMDLKSEVFASILNFIYCSKVVSPGTEGTGVLVAAGKRLGIPFLEKLSEQDRQDDCVKSTDYSAPTVCKKTKKEAPRIEEMDSATGPRITNAFSINEVCPGNNLFVPLVQTNGDRQSPDVGQPPLSCPTISCGNNETTQALSEHSYAVSKSTENKDSSQWDGKKVYKPAITQSKQLIYRNTGPLKKRHRLRATLAKTILPTPAEPQTDTPNPVTPTLDDGVSAAPDTVTTPPPLFSESEKLMDQEPNVTPDTAQIDLGPPPLSPHTEDSISIYGCEDCPEIFTNKALLTIHSEVHKKRFVSHLFCKFCHRKFIHLKRLRNHEQICPKAAKSPPKLHATDVSTKELDLHSGDMPNIESIMAQLPSADPPSPLAPQTPQVDHSELPEKQVRSSSGQRRYNCSVCKRVYVTLSSLKRHENVHSWQRAYPCHYCNKVFALAEYRTKHEIWHTGERRYQCIFCLETFMTYYILKNHQKSFHGIDPSLAVKKKSANGGLKASVYPIKLYRLLPMKFRKRQYKTYSQTYSESLEKGDQAPLESSSLIPPFEENGVMSPDSLSYPVTFMATTKMVAPVMPRISFDKPCDQGVEHHLDSDLELEKGTRQEYGNGEPAFENADGAFSLPQNLESPALGLRDNPEFMGHNVPFLNSLNAVKKLGELSASAKKVEEMTKEILQSSTESLMRDKTVGTKIETYIAKPVCPGPSVDGSAMPLCQITVKIGNEAIIRRRIKGSKLFPKKKRRIRESYEEDSSSQSQIRENSESPRLRLRPEVTAATGHETYEDPNDLDTADMLWRPYYSYKAKKKRKKLRFKHRKALFHHYPETSVGKSTASEDRNSRLTEDCVSSGSEVKRSLSRNSSPRATYNCDICDSSFITETGLRAHVIGSHPCFCRTCGKQGPPGEVPAGGDYICNSCMENGSCFDKSPRSPNPEKKYRCSFCPQRFLYLATKRSHEKKHQETSEKGYNFDKFTPSSKYKSEIYKEDTIKTEDGDFTESPDIKSERVEGGHFSDDKFKPKIEDATNLMSLTTCQDISFANLKSPRLPSINPMFSLTPSNVKHKMQKKKINTQNSAHAVPKKHAYDREGSKDLLTSLRKNNHNEKSCKLFRTNDSETKGAHISLHKPEKWVCKEEPFF
ncbi:zinc finger and BTB domain-containing protein 38 [Xyrichtys novacula]|uniref:Zinc finger and BTB domain-containing protein 38 n=1 Tax=Xyrichtys novacula TaxID=13765 RepID=A0AAV1FZM8_XYRNO|nr:zinc finger and BTB domain-containing protein 38 [Xyrichtys novacula]